MTERLSKAFFQGGDVVAIAAELIGCRLRVRGVDGSLSGGRITEAEAYSGRNDRACHSFGGKRTPRNEVMYGPGGHVYSYLCYGIHVLLNIVTNQAEHADGVLIRAIEPDLGVEHMLQRRGFERLEPSLCAGPGRVSQALALDMSFLGEPVDGVRLWLEPPQEPVSVASGPRVGVDFAGADAALPWRFAEAGSRWVSRPRL